MINIKKLLKEYNIPLSECNFLLRKHYSVEPEEVKEYAKTNMINSFSKMSQIKVISNEGIGIIISNIGFINK